MNKEVDSYSIYNIKVYKRIRTLENAISIPFEEVCLKDISLYLMYTSSSNLYKISSEIYSSKIWKTVFLNMVKLGILKLASEKLIEIVRFEDKCSFFLFPFSFNGFYLRTLAKTNSKDVFCNMLLFTIRKVYKKDGKLSDLYKFSRMLHYDLVGEDYFRSTNDYRKGINKVLIKYASLNHTFKLDDLEEKKLFSLYTEKEIFMENTEFNDLHLAFFKLKRDYSDLKKINIEFKNLDIDLSKTLDRYFDPNKD